MYSILLIEISALRFLILSILELLQIFFFNFRQVETVIIKTLFNFLVLVEKNSHSKDIIIVSNLYYGRKPLVKDCVLCLLLFDIYSEVILNRTFIDQDYAINGSSNNITGLQKKIFKKLFEIR